MEDEERIRERIRERNKAAFFAVAFALFAITTFCLYGIPAIENAPLVRKAKVEVLGLTITKWDEEVISRQLELRMLETGKIENMWLKGKSPFSVEEMGEGNTYDITYKGLWGKREIVSIVLIQSREGLIRKMAESKEMPFVGDWKKDWKLTISRGVHEDGFRMNFVDRFDRSGAYITGHLCYDVSTTPETLKLVALFYYDNDHQLVAVNIWINEKGAWKFYDGGGNHYVVPVPQEDGSVEFEFK